MPCVGRSRRCCTRRPFGSRSSPPRPDGDKYAAALRELFDLDPAAPESVAAVRTSPERPQ